jgi:hypothetical protein
VEKIMDDPLLLAVEQYMDAIDRRLAETAARIKAEVLLEVKSGVLPLTLPAVESRV